MSYKLFLDDYRRPEDAAKYMELPIFNETDWVIVRNYYAFISIIQSKGLPNIIAFDHDLGGDMEIWKDIDGYDGIYSVSTLGQVVRLKKSKGTSGGNLLIPMKNESGLYVMLRNNGNDKKYLIHRLVGKAFLKNPHNKPEINHKDGNRWNNNVDNLEWNTSSENNKHAHNELNREFTAYAENHANSVSVSQYDMLGNIINVFGSVNEVDRQLDISFSNVAKCARGERKSAGGFMWKYENKKLTIKSVVEHIPKKDKNYSNRFFIPETFTEKTGYHCGKWLIDYCIDNKLKVPTEIIIHSMNPVGSLNIKSLFDTYFKVYDIKYKPIQLIPYFMK